jgi:IS30 family transposase
VAVPIDARRRDRAAAANDRQRLGAVSHDPRASRCLALRKLTLCGVACLLVDVDEAKGGTTKSGLGQIVDTVSIRERPADADDRAVPGHWEGDLLCGANNTHIVTLVERHTRFVMLLKVPSKDTATVVAALGKHVSKLPQQLCRSLTWDRGKEMADHKNFTIATKIQVYFCDPRSPWQRGTNENTNGLLRQYFPRGTELSRFSQAHLNRIALRLNQRPRKTLGFETPADKLRAVLH